MREEIKRFPDLNFLSLLIANTPLRVQMKDFAIEIVWLRYYYPAAEENSAASLGEHRHSFYELHYCFNGSCRYAVNGRLYPVEEGQAILISAQQKHTRLMQSPGHGKVAMGFVLTAGDVSELTMQLRRVFGREPAMVFHDTQTLSGLLYDILGEFSRQSIGFHEVVMSKLLQVVIECARQYACGEEAPASYINRIDRRITELNAYIEAHMDERMSCNDLAERVHMSTRQLNRIIQKEFGYSLMTYVNKLRSARARDLLVNSDESISRIAATVGFANEFSFGKFFKRMEGMTPGAFRRSRFNPGQAP